MQKNEKKEPPMSSMPLDSTVYYCQKCSRYLEIPYAEGLINLQISDMLCHEQYDLHQKHHEVKESSYIIDDCLCNRCAKPLFAQKKREIESVDRIMVLGSEANKKRNTLIREYKQRGDTLLDTFFASFVPDKEALQTLGYMRGDKNIADANRKKNLKKKFIRESRERIEKALLLSLKEGLDFDALNAELRLIHVGYDTGLRAILDSIDDAILPCLDEVQYDGEVSYNMYIYGKTTVCTLTGNDTKARFYHYREFTRDSFSVTQDVVAADGFISRMFGNRCHELAGKLAAGLADAL